MNLGTSYLLNTPFKGAESTFSSHHDLMPHAVVEHEPTSFALLTVPGFSVAGTARNIICEKYYVINRCVRLFFTNLDDRFVKIVRGPTL